MRFHALQTLVFKVSKKRNRRRQWIVVHCIWNKKELPWGMKKSRDVVTKLAKLHEWVFPFGPARSSLLVCPRCGHSRPWTKTVWIRQYLEEESEKCIWTSWGRCSNSRSVAVRTANLFAWRHYAKGLQTKLERRDEPPVSLYLPATLCNDDQRSRWDSWRCWTLHWM